jgi:hypothetical protein
LLAKAIKQRGIHSPLKLLYLPPVSSMTGVTGSRERVEVRQDDAESCLKVVHFNAQLSPTATERDEVGSPACAEKADPISYGDARGTPTTDP